MTTDRQTLLKLLSEAREKVNKKYTELRRGKVHSLTFLKRQLALIIESLDNIMTQQKQQQHHQQEQQL